MVVSTALMLAGAGLGAAGGYAANEERVRQSKRKLGLLELAGYNNEKSKEAAAKLLEGQLTLSSLEASSQNEADSLAVGEAKGALEANAGASGLTGGTPFFQLASVAARSMRSAQKAAMARDLSLRGQVAQGAMTIDEYRARGEELSYQTRDALESDRYLDSGISWLLAMGTGALSGAATAAQMSTTLEGMGVNMDAEFSLPKLAVPGSPEALMTEQAVGDTAAAAADELGMAVRMPRYATGPRTAVDLAAIGAIHSLMDGGEDSDPLNYDVLGLNRSGSGSPQAGMPQSGRDGYQQPMIVHTTIGETRPLFASTDLQEGMSRFFLGSPELTGFDIRRPKPMRYGTFGNDSMFQIE